MNTIKSSLINLSKRVSTQDIFALYTMALVDVALTASVIAIIVSLI
jgi:hypothetical protein